VELVQEIRGPLDIELQLDMSVYSSEFASDKEEVFLGTVVAKINVYITTDPWVTVEAVDKDDTA